jgi:hypothetical protein
MVYFHEIMASKEAINAPILKKWRTNLKYPAIAEDLPQTHLKYQVTFM